MARIRTYALDDNVTGSDYWIGTDGNNNSNTKNFSPNSVAKYLNENEVVDISNSIRFRYDTIDSGKSRESGTLSFATEIGAVVPINSLTTFILSKNTQSTKLVNAFLNILPGTKIILQKSDYINIFGIFKVISVTQIELEPDFYTVVVEYISGYGSIEEDKDYIISLIDIDKTIPIALLTKETFEYIDSNSFVLSNEVNNVLQVIINTTSLHPQAYSVESPSTVVVLNEIYSGDIVTIVYNYTEEVVEVPNLQSVTNQGSTTINSITAGEFIKIDGASTEYLMADGSTYAGLGYIPVNKAGDTMLGDLILNEDPSTALGAATKQYVDNISSGINFHFPLLVATDVPLVVTYDNGVNGVGATLTGPSVGVLMIDGETPAYLDRILVWQQADPVENGIYDLTTVGDSLTVYQLTRSSDADNSPPGEIHYGDYTLVLSGDTNGGFGFICNTPGVIDIGITPISYIQFNSAQAVTAGYGLQELNPNVISIDPLVTQEKIVLTTIGSGEATLVSNTLNIPVIGIVSETETGVVNNTSLQELGGVDKTINGVRVGRGNISGNVSENTAVGYQALQSVIHTTGYTGYYNSAFGDKALKSLTSGYANDAFGDAALNLCTTGTFNLAIGIAAMQNATNATQNTAVGQYALQNSISGQKNTAIGLSALGKNTASYNTAIGSYAGGAVLSTGTENILVGYQAGAYITSGKNNLLIENIGSNASITSGDYNIILNPKQRSGITTGSNNTIIGCFDNTFATGLTSNVIIANGLGAIRFQSTDTGLTTVPGQTNALIEADTTGKAVATKEYVNNRLVVETVGPYLLSNADSGGIVVFTASTTLTIPTGLANGFECTFVTLSGVTLTVPAVAGITLNNAINPTGSNVLAPKSSFTLKRMIAANTFIATGNI